MSRTVALAIGVLSTFVALQAAPPSFAFTTIGSDLSTDGIPDICTQPCTQTVVQTALPGRATTAAANGVVTRWSVRSMSGSLQLRVLRPVGNQFQDVGSSGPTSAGGAGVQTFPTRIAIKAGDHIGIDELEGAFLAYRNPVPPGAVAQYYDPRLPDGATAPPTGSFLGESMLNADVEPDADLDGYGDETQDKCPTDATTHDACPDKTAPTTTLSGSGKQNFLKQKAVIVTALPNEAGTVNATGTISVPGASKTLKLKAASAARRRQRQGQAQAEALEEGPEGRAQGAAIRQEGQGHGHGR